MLVITSSGGAAPDRGFQPFSVAAGTPADRTW